MKLSKILENVETKSEFIDCEINDIVYDSRKAKEGTMFVCLVGSRSDGHDFAKSAFENGCRVFLAEREPELPSEAQVVIAENTRAALAACSCSFFDNPGEKLTVIGITGTKGKTSVAHIIQRVLSDGGIKCGIVGTVGAGYDDVKLPTVNTTPESYELQKLFDRMLEGGCKAVAIEVSSLGLKSHRVDGINFDYAVFTNLFPDHIGGDEHKSFDEYKDCKKILFSRCKKAVISLDDDYSGEFIACCSSPVVTFGQNPDADYILKDASNYKSGSTLGVSFTFENGGEEDEMMISIPGKINAMNALVAVAIADDLGVSREKTRSSLAVTHAKGRGEVVETGKDFSIIIDYAHNGISMKSILETVSEYEHNRIITVFGSVGGRAQLRRKELGEASGKLADLSVVTIDDPNFEDPQAIIDEITAAIDSVGGKWVSFVDRGDAIRYAISNAEKGDIIILAGKGHEEFMKVNGEKLPFSETEIIKEALD